MANLDLQIRGAGGGGRSQKQFFSASFWSKNKEGARAPPVDPPMNCAWSRQLTSTSSSSDSADESSCHETKDNIWRSKKTFKNKENPLLRRCKRGFEVKAKRFSRLCYRFVNYMIMNQKFLFFLLLRHSKRLTTRYTDEQNDGAR